MKKISRRSFLKVAGIGAAALGLAACGGSSASTTTSTASSTAASAGGSDAGFTNTTLTLYSPGGENSVPTKTIIKYGELIEEATAAQSSAMYSTAARWATMPRRSSPPVWAPLI